MKVKCINNNQVEKTLTLGKVYDVLFTKSEFYHIKNDFDNEGDYNMERFEVCEVEGYKDTSDKVNWSFMDFALFEGMIKVMSDNVKNGKYPRGNWRKIKNGERDYWEATMRHLIAIQEGDEVNLNKLDDGPKGDGNPHLWHIMCDVMFMEYFRRKKVGEV